MVKRILLTLCFLLLLAIPAYADDRTQANSEIESKFYITDFYPEQITTSKGTVSINYAEYKAIDASTGVPTFYIDNPPQVFSYGQGWGYNSRFGVDRYIGYTVQGHPLGNPAHPFDTWNGGIYEEKPGRISEPWTDLRVRSYIANEIGISKEDIELHFVDKFQNNPEWRQYMMWGLIMDRYNGDLIIDPYKYPDYPWEQYTVVYHPPTADSWGWGRMFREENGSLLYKTVWIPNTIPSIPDFYPTPEGATEWKEEFLKCAKTYTGKPGEQITFPVTLWNQGEAGATDFMAVWEGQGENPEKGWNGSNPPWKAEAPINLGKGESVTFDVTVTVPQPGEPQKLIFKSNVDGMTPAEELFQKNNLMVIVITPQGIDLAIESDETKVIQALAGEPVNVKVMLKSFRQDTGFDPVEAELKWTGPEGEGSRTFIMDAFGVEADYVTFTGYAGNTYYVTGEIMPTVETDIDLSNNKTTTKIIIVIMTPQIDPDVSKENPSPETRVNLIG